MKLRNKKTGEIVEYISIKQGGSQICMYVFDTAKHYYYRSIAELNEEWEDYKEPKGIKSVGNIGSSVHIELGSKEEAEKAVERLSAWKRLKDKGLKFNKWTIPEEPKTPHIKLVIEAEMDVPDSPYDLDLLFSGEDD